jgi:hypothetical protein
MRERPTPGRTCQQRQSALPRRPCHERSLRSRSSILRTFFGASCSPISISNAAELDLKRLSKGRRDPRPNEVRPRGTECCCVGPSQRVADWKRRACLQTRGVDLPRPRVPYGAARFSLLTPLQANAPLTPQRDRAGSSRYAFRGAILPRGLRSAPSRLPVGQGGPEQGSPPASNILLPIWTGS